VKGLKGIRAKIDALDSEILGLLNKRAAQVMKVRDLKAEASGGKAASVAFVPHRERQVLDRLTRLNPGPFPNEGVLAVFREIMSASLALEGRPRIAYMGPAATFSHKAALAKFGAQCEYAPVAGIPDVFAEVEQGRADLGVVPVENSSEGVIRHTLDLFVDSSLKVCGELALPIRLCLMSKSGKKSGYKAILSHPQPLAQARGWLDRNYPGVERGESSSTSAAAKLAAKDSKIAVIGDALAAEVYGLKVVAKNIQDKSDNMTRFLVIGRTLAEPTGRDKTSVMLSLRDKVGALASMLKPFEAAKISLSSIESRPSRRRPWEYYFFIDFLGHQQDKKTLKLLEALKKRTLELKVLGSYPLA
jgi:chorismate mutase/prephenate dehydratase